MSKSDVEMAARAMNAHTAPWVRYVVAVVVVLVVLSAAMSAAF